MDHLTRFRNPNERFESLGIYVKLRDKFGDLVKQIKAGPNHMAVLLLLEINSYLDQEIMILMAHVLKLRSFRVPY
jgi:hypothetical protein